MQCIIWWLFFYLMFVTETPGSSTNHRSSDHTHRPSFNHQHHSTRARSSHSTLSGLHFGKGLDSYVKLLPWIPASSFPICFVCSLCPCVSAINTYLHLIPKTSSWKHTPSSHYLSNPGNRWYLPYSPASAVHLHQDTKPVCLIRPCLESLPWVWLHVTMFWDFVNPVTDTSPSQAILD